MSKWLFWEKLQQSMSFTFFWQEMSTEMFLQIRPVRFYDWMQKQRSVSFYFYIMQVAKEVGRVGGGGRAAK